jgi:hypothetical protein
MKIAALLAGAALLTGAGQTDTLEQRNQLFDALLAAIRSNDAPAVARLSRVNDIMYMRGYQFISAENLLERLRGCTIASTMRPTVEGGMAGIRFSCPGRAARAQLQPCDSGDLFLGSVPRQGRLQLSLDERRRMDGACIPAAPAPPRPHQ